MNNAVRKIYLHTASITRSIQDSRDAIFERPLFKHARSALKRITADVYNQAISKFRK